ncbi:glycosyltransferase family 2 protein [Yoonia sp. 2307UL14-13]|uniref:glycosyltransferase family 2 protein n=1 Tax=Yoonia sp. 2307UL14-13 TaxID=3126506 RepID=UPI0030A68546
MRRRRQLQVVSDRTDDIAPGAILAFCCVRNEAARLPHFLDHYRALGVDHFLFVDNGSDDVTSDLLVDQPDASLWHADDSYRLARFGMDWLGWLQARFGHGHWCLTVDADELLVYPEHDSQDLRALTGWLDQRDRASFGAMMVELYPRGPIGDAVYAAGDDPLETLTHFDADNYRRQWHPVYDNLWIQGGVRDRVFFAEEPARAPTLNKTPLVKWHRRYVYVSSTHQLLPRRLHDVFGMTDTPMMTGALLHTKFLPTIVAKSKEELQRKQHFENTALYRTYHEKLARGPTLWHSPSHRYAGWRQLVDLGLMSSESWV